MTPSGYLRYPTIRGDLLAFVADDDIWLAPADGGLARRLTPDRAPASHPRISPDGSLVAWTSMRDGPPEVYLAATDGGSANRVTYWSDRATRTHDWSPDGELVVATAAWQPFGHQTWAYAIPVEDGTASLSGLRRLPFGPVADLAMNGQTVALEGGWRQEPAFWKRYRGGTAGRLWLARSGGDEPFRRVLADLRGQLSCPMLVAGRLAFISDHEGTGNIYSCALDGSDLRRHTDHDGFYVRNASSDGSRVVYHCAGDIWLLADFTPDGQPVRLDVRLGTPAMGRAPGLTTADDHLDGLCCDRTGQASAVQVRGTVHWLTHRDGPARALSVIEGPVARLPRVLGETGQVIWVVEADGGDALEVAAADGTGANGTGADGTRAGGADADGTGADGTGADGTGGSQRPRRIAAGEIGWVARLVASPDGRSVAAAARDGRLLLVDVASGQVTELARSDGDPVSGLAFAPDSAWLAWSQPGRDPLARIRLVRLADLAVSDVTDGRFADTDPVFTGDGKYLAFLSRRTFDPVYDAQVFDLSFPYGSRPYLVTLAADTPSPFGPLVAGRPIGPAKADQSDTNSDKNSKQGDGDEADGPQPVRIDTDGLGDRIVQVPVPEARYRSLRAVDGGLAWLSVPLSGELGESGASLDDERPRPALDYFDIKRVKYTELQGEVDWFDVSGDGSRLAVRDRGKLLVMPANRKADPDNPDDRLEVDLSRARFLADPAALWRAAYGQVGRAIRHEFWVADMAEADWDGALEAYRPLLDQIATPDDFADLVHEVIAELGSSHAYVRPADGADHAGQRVGMLGADLESGPDGWRVARVLPGESSDPRARSPLAAPGTTAIPGDVLLAIDGQSVDVAAGPAPLLVGAAGKPVELTVRRAGEDRPRRAVVVPLADDRRLRYQDWVAGRRQRVRELSGGRLGYLHVPDMMSEGWSDFHRDLRTEMRSEGLVVDVRANRGGHTSQLVVEKLARRVIGWDVPRYAKPESYPLESPRGPVVAVTDDFAGSDGDIVTAAVQLLGIGPVVGTRTWGGVIGIEGWHELVDGTAITVPKFSFWFSQLGWSVENYGVDPDVEVVITPDDWAAGTDPQLETAVRMALEALERQPAATPPGYEDRPSRRRPALPPRVNPS